MANVTKRKAEAQIVAPSAAKRKATELNAVLRRTNKRKADEDDNRHIAQRSKSEDTSVFKYLGKSSLPISREYVRDDRPAKLIPFEPFGHRPPTKAGKVQRLCVTFGNRTEQLDFFDLAGETRNQIYEYYLTNTEPLPITSKNPLEVEMKFPLLFAARKLAALRDVRISDPAKRADTEIEEVLREARVERYRREVECAARDGNWKAQNAAEMELEAARGEAKKHSFPALAESVQSTSTTAVAPLRSREIQHNDQTNQPTQSIRRARRTLSAINHSLRRKGLQDHVIKIQIQIHVSADPTVPPNLDASTACWLYVTANQLGDYKSCQAHGQRYNVPMTLEERVAVARPRRQSDEKRKAGVAGERKSRVKMERRAEEKGRF